MSLAWGSKRTLDTSKTQSLVDLVDWPMYPRALVALEGFHVSSLDVSSRRLTEGSTFAMRESNMGQELDSYWRAVQVTSSLLNGQRIFALWWTWALTPHDWTGQVDAQGAFYLYCGRG